MFETESSAIMFFLKYSYLKKLDDQASVASDFDSWRNIMNWSFICSIYRTHQKINTIIYDHTHHENQSFWTIFLERLTVSDNVWHVSRFSSKELKRAPGFFPSVADPCAKCLGSARSRWALQTTSWAPSANWCHELSCGENRQSNQVFQVNMEASRNISHHPVLGMSCKLETCDLLISNDYR